MNNIIEINYIKGKEQKQGGFLQISSAWGSVCVTKEHASGCFMAVVLP